jgi:hypothetical protein
VAGRAVVVAFYLRGVLNSSYGLETLCCELWAF